MALEDIIGRIASDAGSESQQELSAAAARAEAILSAARAKAQADTENAIEAAKRNAASRAATEVATARLEARDRALSAKREVVAAALDGVVEALEALPDERYVRFLASGIADAVRDGDTVSLASDDNRHLGAVRAAVASAAPDVSIEWAQEPAPLSRGALITGPRTRVEVTPASVVDMRKDELELKVSTRLFVGEGR